MDPRPQSDANLSPYAVVAYNQLGQSVTAVTVQALGPIRCPGPGRQITTASEALVVILQPFDDQRRRDVLPSHRARWSPLEPGASLTVDGGSPGGRRKPSTPRLSSRSLADVDNALPHRVARGVASPSPMGRDPPRCGMSGIKYGPRGWPIHPLAPIPSKRLGPLGTISLACRLSGAVTLTTPRRLTCPTMQWGPAPTAGLPLTLSGSVPPQQRHQRVRRGAEVPWLRRPGKLVGHGRTPGLIAASLAGAGQCGEFRWRANRF